MDYSNKLIIEHFQQLDKSYNKRALLNPLTKSVWSTFYSLFIYYLLEHSELFDTPQDYTLFHKEHTLSKKDLLLASAFIPAVYTQYVYQTVSPNINQLFNRNINNRRYSFDGEYKLQEARSNLAQHQSQELTDFITKKLDKLTSNTHRYTATQYNQLLKQYKQRLHNLLVQQEQQKDHVIKYTEETLKPQEEQRRYKQWIWCPNPRTRHTTMADKIVPIDEPFKVHSDNKYCEDCFMMYPLDPDGTVCQCANCKCTYIFTNKKRGV